MYLFLLLLKKIFHTGFFLFSLFTCQKKQQNKDANYDIPIQINKILCDSTKSVSQISIPTLLGVFYKTDTFAGMSLQNVNKLHVFIKGKDSLTRFASITRAISGDIIQTNIENKKSILLSWSEKQMMGAMLYDEKYLYNRWESLLLDDRKLFLQKRDSILTILKASHPSAKVISDIRSLLAQKKYLKNNKTASPLSMHNFGFAADFAIFNGNKINNNFSLYKPLNQLTLHYKLTWGGNFVGFVDPGHVQLFKNGAAMLAKYPDLIFEFDPFYSKYESWYQKMIDWGKENKAQDTKEILLKLNLNRLDKACACSTIQSLKSTDRLNGFVQEVYPKSESILDDLIIIADLTNQTVSVQLKDKIVAYRVGKWGIE